MSQFELPEFLKNKAQPIDPDQSFFKFSDKEIEEMLAQGKTLEEIEKEKEQIRARQQLENLAKREKMN